MIEHNNYSRGIVATGMLSLVAIILLFGCTNIMPPTTMPPTTPPATANYSVTMRTTWSQERNGGTSFPGGAHFSSLIGAVHNSSYQVWNAGATASAGIELMAETGGTGTLRTEVRAQMAAGKAKEVISGGGIGRAAGSVTTMFQASQQFSLASVVSMLAPSPDWFIGVHDVQLFRDNRWVEEVELTLEVYDSGSDSGRTFSTPNINTVPKEPIARLMGNSELGFATQPQRNIGTMRFELQ